MPEIQVNAELEGELAKVTTEAHLVGAAGQALGYFVPVERFDDLMAWVVSSQVTTEELEAAAREPGGSSLEEVMARLAQIP